MFDLYSFINPFLFFFLFSSGSSGMKEVCGGKVLWHCSTQRGFRYNTMVSNGDSKLYDSLVEVNSYGPDHPIKKEECVNHVGKPLDTALRNLVADKAKQGITLGGIKTWQAHCSCYW